MKNSIIILDFGSQYTQLITRRIRDLGVYSQIYPFNISLDEIKKLNPKGIILSGGPSSVYEDNAPDIDEEIFNLGVPILGVCYGMQLISYKLGGKVERAGAREYGKTMVELDSKSMLFKGINKESLSCFMSHSDKVTKIPEGFTKVASSSSCNFAAIENKDRNIYGLQFHAEVSHSEDGEKVLANFVFNICNTSKNWAVKDVLKTQIEQIKEQVKDSKVICALSGGVDSSVVASLIHKAIGNNLTCIFINNGLLRLNEEQKVLDMFKDLDLNVCYVDASEKFLKELKGVEDPEQKRKIIGRVFIEVLEEQANKIENVKYLAQGTLYPDIIESTSIKGPSSVIKSHHNVGGLPEKMKLKLLEPVKYLFKDEVRKLGLELGMKQEMIERHPFPGPGLAVRILGDITQEKLDILRQADDILINEIRERGLYNSIWQLFAVLLPIRTVGVKGDERSYDRVCAIRAVESVDGMTAKPSNIDLNILFDIADKIANEVDGLSKVVYDLSSKPPSTIEWE